MKMLARVRNSSFAILVALLCFAPSALALARVHDSKNDKNKCGHDSDCKVTVAEGGSSGMYLLLAGASCLGAMCFKSRQQLQDEKF